MKPNTKKEKAVCEINSSLRPLTENEKEWAFRVSLFHKCRLLKSYKGTCLDCGHQWQLERGYRVLKQTYCPNCKRKLEIENTRAINFNDDGFVLYVQTHKGYQVTRAFKTYGIYRVGEKARLSIREISRFYIDSDGMEQVFSATRTTYWRGDNWGHDVVLRYRKTLDKYLRYTEHIYPRRTIRKDIKRNGYDGKLCGYHPHFFFHKLLNDSKLETLIKHKRYDIAKARLDDYKAYKIDKYWSAIKVCLKEKYPIGSNAIDLYLDYLDDLEHFEKDWSNKRWCCPDDFMLRHRRFTERKRKLALKKKVAELKTQLKSDQKKYSKHIKKYKNLKFSAGHLSIEVTQTVKQLMEESHTLNHCAFSSTYHQKKSSLMFSAFYKEMIIETIEFSLNRFELLQARGQNNKPSLMHDMIIELFEANIPLIKKAHMEKSKKVKPLKQVAYA